MPFFYNYVFLLKQHVTFAYPLVLPFSFKNGLWKANTGTHDSVSTVLSLSFSYSLALPPYPVLLILIAHLPFGFCFFHLLDIHNFPPMTSPCQKEFFYVPFLLSISRTTYGSLPTWDSALCFVTPHWVILLFFWQSLLHPCAGSMSRLTSCLLTCLRISSLCPLPFLHIFLPGNTAILQASMTSFSFWLLNLYLQP